jgi:Peptidyl-prolyl cis-trans isomerase (rotamase) - cyclophilin family
VSSSRESRQRAAARARLERQMAARREAARRRRRLQARIAGGVASVVLLGAIVWIVVAVTSDEPDQAPTPVASDEGWPCSYEEAFPQPSAEPTPADDPSATGDPADPSASPESGEEPTPTPSLPEGIQDVGFPISEPPRSGFQVFTFETNLGTIEVEADLSKTPCTANSIAYLANQGFYDNTSCHRLVPDIYALQCGDPSGTGRGGPNYRFADENLPLGQLPAYHEGDVAMANAGPDTNGSQFFFVYGVNALPGNYTLWGKVISGMDVIKQVAAGGVVEGSEELDGGPHPTVQLTFTKVTAGPVTPASVYTPTPTPSESADASAEPSPADS